MQLLKWIKSNYFNILLFIIICLIISPVILSKPLNNLDEVWIYNFAKNIADGLVPYRDFNLVITPLIAFIGGLFLKILGNELIIMRILAILLISFIFFMTYQILNKLKINKYYNFAILFLLFLLLKEYICIDYNFAILAIILILIYLSFNESFFYSKKGKFIIGILCGLCISLKQSTGSIVAFISVFYPILFIKNKLDLKNYIKNAFIQIIGILIPVLFLLIYLLINHATWDFIDYTILGIKTFTNSIPYTRLLTSSNLAIKCLSKLTPIFILLIPFWLWKKKATKLYGFYFYSLSSLVVIFPISDNIHFLIGIFPILILFCCLLFYLLIWFMNKIKNIKIILFTKETFKMATCLFLICYLITSFILLANYINDPQKNHSILHYTQIPISEQLLNKINIIDNYILSQNVDVYTLDAEAAIYMISIDVYHKNYDLFLKGNLGGKGEDGQIEEINHLPKGTQLLIKNDNYKRNWQSPEKVISYIKNTFNKIGNISIFDIYEI